MPKQQGHPSPQAVIYARVSSKEQEKEGFSIPAQLKLLRQYAMEQGLLVIQEYVDVETAKRAGRTGFTEMVGFFKKQMKGKVSTATRRILLVEKTDRLYRNLKDWVTLDELDLEIHLVKENVILSWDSRSSEKFMHGIKVLMAKNYIDNLSEEVKKGMLEPTLSRCSERKNRLPSAACLTASRSFRGGLSYGTSSRRASRSPRLDRFCD